MTTIPETLTLAGHHYHAGNLQAAEALYRQVLHADPACADALHYLGLIAFHTGNLNVAVDYMERSVAVAAMNEGFHINLAMVYQARGQPEQAAASYRRVLTINPNRAEAHNNLAVALQQLGKLPEAQTHWQTAVALRPDYVDAWANLGNVQRALGNLDEALRSLHQALRLQPDFAPAHDFLAGTLQLLGKLDEAAASHRQALRCNPGFTWAHHNLGVTLQQQGKFADAAASFRQAVHFHAQHADAWQGLGLALLELGDEQEGLACLEQAQRLHPCHRNRIIMAAQLPVIHQSVADLLASRNRLVQEIGRLRDQHIVLDVTEEPAIPLFYVAYHGLNDRKIQREMAQLFHAPEVELGAPAPTAGTDDKKIHLGFLSAFFHDHTIGQLMRGLVANLSRQDFVVTVLSVGSRQDAIAGFFRQRADRYVEVPKHLPAARRLIAAQRLDVLCYPEVGMDHFAYTLALSRLAPVQCVTWGHPVTTGMASMDYFLSSEDLETAEADGHYTETLVRLKSLPIYYYKPQLPSSLKDRSYFGIAREDHVYACPQTLFKFHPDFDEVLGSILRADPRGILLLIKGKLPHWEHLLRQRFTATLGDVVDRIRFLPSMPRPDFLNLLALADVLLDPVHFGGGNTSYEGLAVGTPIVTLPSRFLRGRITYALYKQMIMLDCVAQNPGDYVKLALRLGSDADFRIAMRNKILAANAVLYENSKGIRELEQWLSRLRLSSEATSL